MPDLFFSCPVTRDALLCVCRPLSSQVWRSTKTSKREKGGTHLLKWMKSVVIDHPAPGKESPSSVNNEMMKNIYIYIYIYLKYFDDDDTSSIYNNNGCNCKNVFFFHGNLAYRGCDVEMSGIFFFYLFF